MKKYHTYFFDIDGTIFKYRQFESYKDTPAELTTDAQEKLQEVHDAGHTIILTTARPETLRDFTINELNRHGLPWHQLVMGLARGPRHLVNDMSPSEKSDRAIGWNLERDEGLSRISVVKLEENKSA